MPCIYPLQGLRSDNSFYDSGKPVVRVVSNQFDVKSFPGYIPLPCGRCISCRLRYSCQWAIRCAHEASLYDDNCFITLTYRDSCIPDGNTLLLADFQNFMKRLRFRFGEGIRYFHCGEYGSLYKRPHYHACLFNFDFPDKVFWKMSKEFRLFRSAILEELWPYGYSSIGAFSFATAAYVSRYIMKKSLGPSAWKSYSIVDFDTGEILFSRKPEYVTMSRRSAIGNQWITKYMEDTYKDDFLVLGGKKFQPPKYYDSLFEHKYPSDFARIKDNRKSQALKYSFTPDRLIVLEKCLNSKNKDYRHFDSVN